MSKAVKHIGLDELAENLEGILDHVVHERTEIVVETTEGNLAVIKPLATRGAKHRLSNEDDKAFLSSAGGWVDAVNVEAFKKANAESRRLAARPAVTV